MGRKVVPHDSKSDLPLECTIMHHWDCYSGKKLLPKSRQKLWHKVVKMLLLLQFYVNISDMAAILLA